jgi:hypothetical protein
MEMETRKLALLVVMLVAVAAVVLGKPAQARTCCTYCGNQAFSTQTASSCSGSENAVANDLRNQANADCGSPACWISGITFTETCRPVSGGFESSGNVDFSCTLPCGVC